MDAGRARPTIAPLVPLAVAVAAGVVVDRFGTALPTAAWGAIAATAAGVALIERRKRVGIVATLLAFGAIGAGWHHRRWSDLPADDLARVIDESPRPAWVKGVVAEVPTFRPGERPGDEGTSRTVLAATAVRDGDDWRPASGHLQLLIGGDRSDLRAGEPLQAAGALAAIPGPLNPGELDPRELPHARGIRLRLTVDEPSGVWPVPDGHPWPWTRALGRARAWSHDRLVAGLDPEIAPLAAALLLGRREGVDPDVNDAFARTGTTHLLAISGLHLQALAALILFACLALGSGRKSALLAVIAATAAYAILVGLMPSVVRAAAMTIVAGLGGLRDRCARPANLLAMALLATIALNPAHLFDVGCQLSFLAVTALVWGVAPVARRLGFEVPDGRPKTYKDHEANRPTRDPLDALERRLAPWWKRGARRIFEHLALGVVASVVVWLATLPLVALRFHMVAPVGVLLNLPLIPMTSLALLAAGLALGLSALWGPLGRPAAWACGWLLAWTERLVRRGVALPGGHAFVAGPSPAWVVGFYVLLAMATLAIVRRWRGRAWIASGFVTWSAAGIALAILPNGPGHPEAEVLAVGHGLAVVVRDEGGGTTLYDCGRMLDPHVGRRLVAPALWEGGTRRLDAIILSHADADHYNGLPDLLDRFAVGAVLVPPGFGGPRNPGALALLDEVRRRGVPVKTIAEGDTWHSGAALSFRVLHPPEGWQPDAPDNARSVVLDVAADGRHLILTGDLEGIGLARLLAEPPAKGAVLLAPHHGGRTANPMMLYDRTDPAEVVVSQRRPAPTTRDALAPLAARGVPVLRTWDRGAARVRWEPGGLAVSGFLDGPPVASLSWDSHNSLILRYLLITIVGVLAGLAACVGVAAVEWGAWTLVAPGRRDFRELDPLPSPFEPIAATASDGVVLRGAWHGAEGGSRGRVVVLLHGLGEGHEALRPRGEELARRGWDVAIPDSRARGRSGGAFVSFGGREADDLVAWLDALADRVGSAAVVVAWGRSMGAGVALRAAAADGRLAAVVLEAPFADLRATVAHWLRRIRLPLAGALALGIVRRAQRLAGVPLATPRPLDVAPRVAAPTLIVHGTADCIVPIAAAQALAAAFPAPAPLVVVPGAGHADVLAHGGEELFDRIASFLDATVSRELHL
ncbi:MAG TPA: ComEC/Rec2 family competence protein [Isosphaeraceae bacterium]|jgi:competence protein ComEC|nr:ComEC/Rec2 family competence protein [Isosphaeraceae bacterium]